MYVTKTQLTNYYFQVAWLKNNHNWLEKLRNNENRMIIDGDMQLVLSCDKQCSVFNIIGTTAPEEPFKKNSKTFVFCFLKLFFPSSFCNWLIEMRFKGCIILIFKLRLMKCPVNSVNPTCTLVPVDFGYRQQ